MESDIEYEFPCFNLLCEPAGMWSADDRRFDDPVYGGILLSVNTSTGGEPVKRFTDVISPPPPTNVVGGSLQGVHLRVTTLL